MAWRTLHQRFSVTREQPVNPTGKEPQRGALAASTRYFRDSSQHRWQGEESSETLRRAISMETVLHVGLTKGPKNDFRPKYVRDPLRQRQYWEVRSLPCEVPPT